MSFDRNAKRREAIEAAAGPDFVRADAYHVVYTKGDGMRFVIDAAVARELSTARRERESFAELYAFTDLTGSDVELDLGDISCIVSSNPQQRARGEAYALTYYDEGIVRPGEEDE